ncbi:hypothetical protein LTR08_001497 [Meristemomyces frigidus]|nr:hypothetical protein LTR08_001497 [Meristemomyces frigidus]
MSTVPVTDKAENPVPQKRPAPKRRSTKRPRADIDGSEAGSPAPSDIDGGRPQGSKRCGSSAPRPVIIQQRLKASLMNGDMPQYCIHCGAIETPTWRKLYLKHVAGKPSPLDHVEAEGETIGLEPYEWDPVTGEIARFIVRKSMATRRYKDNGPEKDYETVTVCNPCGLWFHKWRKMRPADRWVRKPRPSKKKSAARAAGPATDGLEPQSEAFFTDQPGPGDTPTDAELPGKGQQLDKAVSATTMRRPSISRPRANSMQPTRRQSGDNTLNASQLNTALARAVQSSPVRFNGSQASPIEIDDATPRPTRRLLFPSPRRDGEVKSLDDNGQASLNATSPSGKGSAQKLSSSLKTGIVFGNGDFSVFEALTYDKENVAPEIDVDDELAHLFEGSPTTMFKTPSKTTAKTTVTTPPTQRPLEHLLKTPTPSSRKRKPLSPSQNAANNASHAAVNDFMSSPSSSRYFLRSTPSRQDRTPGRSSQQEHNIEMTPFSRHLAQMLGDANDSAACTSPSQNFDFSDLPTFTTPGRNLNDMDWGSMGDIMSSEFAVFDNGQGASSGGKGTLPDTAGREEA